MADDAVLELCNLEGFYSESQILHGVDLAVKRGEIVTLVGRNGAGKTTTLRAIMGILRRRRGSVRVMGRETIGQPPERIARLGIGYVPEERGIFASLSVSENLMLPPRLKPGGMSLDEIYALFPNLKERNASSGAKLSGGEQQMLAIARVLRTGADFLVLDEPTEGLAPVIVGQIGVALDAIRRRGMTVLLVEQNFRFAAGVSDRHYVMETGRIVDMVPRAELGGSLARLEAYLGV
ncbi:MAG TPA: ABC transporter ATP-binding protein [Stellaceae bacterium]|jgi:branched-chain amino acid transport system ATP-binding protein|nr:ABC transporter ATP-binding protein [Stellaceae bacterium]